MQRVQIHSVEELASYPCVSRSIFSHCVNQLRSSPSGNLTESQTCVIPEDCELSPWSQWTPHNSSCIDTDGQLRQGYMVHTRSIINLPLGAGRPCQSLVHYFPLKTQNEKPCVRLVFSYFVFTILPIMLVVKQNMDYVLEVVTPIKSAKKIQFVSKCC